MEGTWLEPESFMTNGQILSIFDSTIPYDQSVSTLLDYLGVSSDFVQDICFLGLHLKSTREYADKGLFYGMDNWKKFLNAPFIWGQLKCVHRTPLKRSSVV